MAGINLSKGEVINLSKAKAGLNEVIVGLGWDPVKPTVTKGLFGLKKVEVKPMNIDCDAFAVPVVNGAKAFNDTLYFGRRKVYDGSMIHSGDNLTGDGDGDDEQLIMKLASIPANVNQILVGVNIYSGRMKGQTFDKIDNAFIRIVDKATNTEMCRYDLSNNSEFKGVVTMHFGTLNRVAGEWIFTAVGESSPAASIGEFAKL